MSARVVAIEVFVDVEDEIIGRAIEVSHLAEGSGGSG